MRRNPGFLIFCVFVVLIFASCLNQNYVPCSIKIVSPVRGTVLSPDGGSVTVTGKVIKGDADPVTLKANYTRIGFDKTTGDFSYTFTPDDGELFNTIQFTITDKKLVSNTERVSYPVGQSMKAGETDVVDNALRVHMDQDLLDLVIGEVVEVINSVKEPLIYGPAEDNEVLALMGITQGILESPLEQSIYPMGSLHIDNSVENSRLKGLINIGQISIVPDIALGDKILVSLIISPVDGVDPDGPAALYIQGYHERTIPSAHFALGLEEVRVENAELSLYMDEYGNIGAKLDLTKGDVILKGLKLEYGYAEFKSIILDWLVNTVIKKYLISSLSIDFGFMNVSDLSFDLMDIGIGIWPMSSSILTTTDDDMNLDLGISAVYSGVVPAVAGLDMFYATPGDVLPELEKTSDENIMLAVSDDFMNEASLALVQTGLLNNLDMSDLVSSLVSSISDEPAEMYVSLLNPPVFDFSGTTNKIILSSKLSDLGCVSIRDLLVELKLKAGKMPLALRLSIDADAYLKLKIKDTGNIGVAIDKTNTDIHIKILYMNGINTSYIPEFGRIIINQILAYALDQMIDVSLPAVDLIGKSISVEIVGTDAEDNYLIGRAKLIIK